MFKERVKEQREKLGISQCELARRIGVSYTAIQGYEKGTKIASGNTLVALADEFGCTTDYLLGRE